MLATCSQVWLLITLLISGSLFIAETKIKKDTETSKYAIGIYWMLQLLIGVLLIIASPLIVILTFGSSPDIYNALIKIGIIFIISCSANACIEMIYNFILTQSDIKRAWLIFGIILAIAFFIISTGTFFHLI